MGYGEYSRAAHVALTSHRPSSPAVFRTNECHPLMVPHGVHRESRDSEEHPESLAVMFALDVTGSMGTIPQSLANRTLPDFMGTLLDAGIAHPQVCFMAIGHAGHDLAPLQVGQFESSARLIDQWLTRIWMEGGGVGQHEAYELAMYFAARKVELDCVTKRGRRGYLFLTGDVAPNPAVSKKQVAQILGDTIDSDIPIRDLLEELQRQFEPFFMIAPGAAHSIERVWRDLLGDRVVRLEDMSDAAYVASGLVALLEGSAGSLGELVQRLGTLGLAPRRAGRIAKSLVPFAASLGLDGAPKVHKKSTSLPKGDRESGLTR